MLFQKECQSTIIIEPCGGKKGDFNPKAKWEEAT